MDAITTAHAFVQIVQSVQVAITQQAYVRVQPHVKTAAIRMVRVNVRIVQLKQIATRVQAHVHALPALREYVIL